MPATTARIGFILQAYRSVTAGPDSAVIAKYGAAARDTQDAPVETYFESTVDADAVKAERFTLLSADRRRFQIEIARLINFTGGLDYTVSAPAALLVDDEKNMNATVMITGIEAKDYQNERTTLNLWG